MSQRGIYTVRFSEVTIASASGDYDLFEITPADDKPLELVALFLGNKSEIGDAQDEMMSYQFVTDNTTTGNGTSTTPNPLDPSDGTASFTAETVASSPSTGGTAVFLHTDTFNVRAGLQLIIPEIIRPKWSQSDTMFCVRMTSGVTDDLTLSGTAYVREL